MVGADGTFKGFANINDIRRSATHDITYEAFNLLSSRISLDINFNSSKIVPDKFKDDLSKVKEITEFVEYFDQFLLKTQNTSFELVSTVNLSLDLLLGMEQAPNTTKKKTQQLYDVYGLSLHLGTFTVNFDLQYMNDFLLVTKNLVDLLVLSNITEFRPFLKPVTAKECAELQKARGKEFTPEEQATLKQLRQLIIRDYFRLYSYTALFKKYKSLSDIDVKRRLIWKFKKGSMIYQLLMGKTQMQLAEEEQAFLKEEVDYIEKKKAIDLNDRLYYESILGIEPGESGFDIYIKNIKDASNFLSPYCLMIKVSLDINVNLMDLPEGQQRISSTKELEAEITNICTTFVKMKGALMFDVGFKIDKVELKFKEQIERPLLNYVSETIKKVLIEDNKVYAGGMEQVLTPFRMTEVSLSVLCQLLRGPKGELSGAVRFETKINLGKFEVCFSPLIAKKIVKLKRLADFEIKIIEEMRSFESNKTYVEKFVRLVRKVHKNAKHLFYLLSDQLQNTTPAVDQTTRLISKFILEKAPPATEAAVVQSNPSEPKEITEPQALDHSALYLEWRKKRDFKIRQSQKFKSFLKRMDHNLFFMLSRRIGDLVQNVMDSKLLLDMLQVDIKLKLSTFVFSLNDNNNEVSKADPGRSGDRSRPRPAVSDPR